jgi:glycosyltransferase involved in cell wall biosynthesis
MTSAADGWSVESETRRDGIVAPNVLIVAARFPSRIQPWLLNQIEQICLRGGKVRIVAEGPLDGPYQPKVDDLGLLEATEYYPATTAGVVAGLKRLAFERGERGARARHGLRRLGRSPWCPGHARAWAKAAARAPVYATPGIELVHSHSLSQAYEYRHVALLNDIPLVHTFHGLTPRGVRGLSEAMRTELFSITDVALVNTRFAQGQLEALGCPGEKIEILPQGIRVSDFSFATRQPSSSGPVRILTVGRLQPDKGIEYAIRAIAVLRAQGRDVEYRVIGEGPEEGRLRAVARELRTEQFVTLTGGVDDATLRDAYRDADVFILPSVASDLTDHTETQGVVIQEAQASGAIVAASRVGGIPECVEDGVSAFLFEERSPVAIAMTVASIIDRPERWEEWQSRGRDWVERNFDVDVLGERLCRVYARSLANRAGTGGKHSPGA